MAVTFYLLSLDDNSRLFLHDKKTSFGKEDCDIVLKSPVVEKSHAIIEIDTEENSLYLQDLNTAHGTYVNGVRVQNAVVRLGQGDLIRFGHAGPSYEICMEQYSNSRYPPIITHRAWETISIPIDDSNITTATSANLPHLSYNNANAIPHSLASSTHTQSLLSGTDATADNEFHSSQRAIVVPRPPSRSRLQSGCLPGRPKHSHVVDAAQTNISGDAVNSIVCRAEENEDGRVLELEQRLLKMGDELSRLAAFEAECYRKDNVIVALRNEMSEINTKLLSNNQTIGQSSSGATRISAAAVKHLQDENHHLAREVLELRSMFADKQNSSESHQHEMLALQNQLNIESETVARLQQEIQHISMKGNKHSDISANISASQTNNFAKVHSEIAAKDQHIAMLQVELDKATKQRNQANTLVSTLQRDTTTKDKIIARSKTDIDKLRREFRDKENSITSLTLKLSKLKSGEELEKDIQKKTDEIKVIKSKLRASENQQRDVAFQIANLKNDVQENRNEKIETSRVCDNLKKEVHYLRTQFTDLEHAEKNIRSKLADTEDKALRFRTRVIDAIQYDGSNHSNRRTDDLNDDDIFQLIYKLGLDQVTFRSESNDLRQSQEKQNNFIKEVENSRRHLERHVEIMEKRLIKGGRTCENLEYEIEMLNELGSSEYLQWAKKAISNLLSQEMTWEQEIEDALLDAGISIKKYQKETPDLIKILATKADGAQLEMNNLRDRISSMEDNHRKSLIRLKEQCHHDKEQELSEAITSTKAEERRHRDELMAETRRIDLEKLEQLQAHTGLTESENISNLEKAATQAERLSEERNEEILSLRDELEHLKMSLKKAIETERNTKMQLADSNDQLQSANRRLSTIQQETMERAQYEISTYKEQAMQHSLTIVALEDRCVLLNREKAALEMDLSNSTTKSENRLSETAPVSPPSPRETINEAELKHNELRIFELEESNSQLKDQLDEVQAEYAEQCNVTSQLKVELERAYAKLTDTAADIDEDTKKQIDELCFQIKQRDEDLFHSKEELRRYTELVHRQDSQIDTLAQDLDYHKNAVVEYRAELELERNNDAVIKKENDQKMLEYNNQKVNYENEYKAIASTCLADRHEVVISRQKEAIIEYRAKLQSLQRRKSSVPSYDLTLRQVEALKSELVDVRSDLAYRNDDLLKNETDLQKEVRVLRELLRCAKQEFNIEQAANQHCQESLDLSEEMFLRLLRSLASSFGMSIIPGCKTITTLSSIDRNAIIEERKEAIQLILSKCKIYHERLERKEDLLHEYENDLTELRESRAITEEQEQQMRSLMGTVHDYSNEIAFLQEALRQTREELQQQKRLTSSMSPTQNYKKKSKELQNRRNGDNETRMSLPKSKNVANTNA